ASCSNGSLPCPWSSRRSGRVGSASASSCAQRLMTSVCAANGRVLSVMSEPPSFRKTSSSAIELEEVLLAALRAAAHRELEHLLHRRQRLQCLHRRAARLGCCQHVHVRSGVNREVAGKPVVSPGAHRAHHGKRLGGPVKQRRLRGHHYSVHHQRIALGKFSERVEIL